MLDQTAAAAGLPGPRDQPDTGEPDAADAVHRAWFVAGRGLSDAVVYRDTADEFGGRRTP
ncbi:hypothetical protein ACFYT4_09100 [Streptomyces sp. NPDC004609]|uniref:hypothetical protein n=1 Tax=Streptomyces sp. NPDC004609 TaxID=3364704 RepID=UPI0036D0B036